jgi:hypothetical protein
MIVVAGGGIELGLASDAAWPLLGRGGDSNAFSSDVCGCKAAAAAFAPGRVGGIGTALPDAAPAADLVAGLVADLAAGLAAGFALASGLAADLAFASGFAGVVVCALDLSALFDFWASFCAPFDAVAPETDRYADNAPLVSGAAIAGCASAKTPATASGQIAPERMIETNGGFPGEMRIVDFQIDSYCIDRIDESENSPKTRLQLGAPCHLSPN